MRRIMKANSTMQPEPVCIIASYDSNYQADAMNAAWGGISDNDEIHLCLSKEHRTVKNILLRQDFSVSVAVEQYVAACDYVGLVSFDKQPDKVTRAGFTTVKSMEVDAPIIEQLPYALLCRLISYDENTGHLYAKILARSIDDSILTDDKIDFAKFKPLVFDGDNHLYRLIGQPVAEAFSVGKKFL